MMRRFSSAAVVRSEAFQSQIATMITNAKTSAVALNAPRPAHLARRIACRFTFGERLRARAFPFRALLCRGTVRTTDCHGSQRASIGSAENNPRRPSFE